MASCEDALMQGADVNADCGAGMCALHMTALRGTGPGVPLRVLFGYHKYK